MRLLSCEIKLVVRRWLAIGVGGLRNVEWRCCGFNQWWCKLDSSQDGSSRVGSVT